LLYQKNGHASNGMSAGVDIHFMVGILCASPAHGSR
jgi:hypothetical protein